MSAIRDEVRAEVLRRFSPEAQDAALRALTDLEQPPAASAPWERDRARVHLAIIKLAEGDLDRLLAAVALARIDWRDTLCAAGLANGDWRAVLLAAGYPVPTPPDDGR